MESLLVLGIVGFYLCDVSLMLYVDEVVFAKCFGKWRAHVGSGFMLGGRYLALPGLWSPGAPVFRSGWGLPADEDAPAVERLVATLRPLRWPARVAALLLFVVVPVALQVNLSPGLMLGVLGLLYLTSALSVAYVVRRRVALGLSRRDVAAIAFDVIACPPFAINMVRRVTLRCGLGVPANEFAAMLLDARAHGRLAGILDARRALMADVAAGDAAPGDSADPPSRGT